MNVFFGSYKGNLYMIPKETSLHMNVVDHIKMTFLHMDHTRNLLPYESKQALQERKVYDLHETGGSEKKIGASVSLLF